MLSPLDFEGAIQQKEMEVEERGIDNQLIELMDGDEPHAGPLRLSLARIFVGIGLKLDPAIGAVLAKDAVEEE